MSVPGEIQRPKKDTLLPIGCQLFRMLGFFATIMWGTGTRSRDHFQSITDHKGGVCFDKVSTQFSCLAYIRHLYSQPFRKNQRRMMRYLWSPWRMTYIQSDKNENGCAFCQELVRSDGPGNLIVARGKHTFLILNRYPYTSGHVMVVPYAHVSTLSELDHMTRTEMMEIINRAINLLQELYHPQGFNIGINIGIAAGAGITEHIHMHAVPRWTGDTNFMSALGNTRVLPESLEESYQRIKEAWDMLISPP